MTIGALKHAHIRDPLEDQRAASDPDASVWVNASAGSGKTTVLTARVTRLLLSGVLPQKILCLTYTRAGAAEMANRVTALFSKWASCDDNSLRDDLARLEGGAPSPRHMTEARRLFARVLACPGGLRIRTIHSFCQEILSRFPIEAGLPPHFALIDEQELEILKKEASDDLLREAAADPASALAQALSILVEAQGEHGFARMLQDAARERGRLAEAARQMGGAEKLIARMRGLLQLEPGDTPDALRAQAMRKLPEADMRRMADWLVEGRPTVRARGRKLAEILAVLPDERAVLFEDYLHLFLTDALEPRKIFANKELVKQHPEIDAIAGAEATRMRLALERIEAADIARLTEAVLIFGSAFAARLAARKASRAALDYDDLILRADALLKREGIAPWILYKLDNGIDHILVDEAQDTSRAQWNIVQALTQEFYAGSGARGDAKRTLFVVGDEKQSIFSFQNADPQAFLDLRDFFTNRLAAAGKKLDRIGLHTSFRSAPAILRAVDRIFAGDRARAGVSGEPVIHTPFKNRDGSDKIGRVELWPLLQPAKEEKSPDPWAIPVGYEDEHDPKAELAQQIAYKIKKWIASGNILPGTARPIVPGDIMILLRRRGGFADLMVRALKAANVPVTGVDRMRLVRQLPVMDLLAVLRFVLLPEDDLNLATVLRSPLFTIGEDQLMELAIGREGALWQSLKDHAAHSPVFADAHDYLAARLGEADFSTPFAFLSRLLNAPCPANAVSARMALWARLGDEAMDPVEELLNAAQHFSRSRPPSLQNFLHWLTQADAEIKRELDQGGGQVRIMTVHASKGLEAPIVFLPDTASVPRAADIPKFQWSAEGVPLFLARRPDFGMARHLWQAARQRQMEEYRRLFYVALTRAEKRLYICGWQSLKRESDEDQSWYNLAYGALQPEHQDYLREDPAFPAPTVILGDAAPPAEKTAGIKAASAPPAPLPGWALHPAEQTVERAALFPPSTADAAAAATPDAAFARGRIIHRLLQSLPDIAPGRRAQAIDRFLAQQRHQLNGDQRAEIAGEVGRLLQNENFAALFGPDSRAEIPLTGSINGIAVFRQIDRLCLRGNEVWIVDYKTNRPPPASAQAIPDAYRQQLAEYRSLLSGIYPDKQVRCFLLWTYSVNLMEVSF